MNAASLIPLSGDILTVMIVAAVAIGVEFLYRHLYKRTRDEQHSFERKIKKFTPEVEFYESKFHTRETMLGVVRLGIFVLLIIITLDALKIETFSLLTVLLGTLVITLREYVLSFCSYFFIIIHFRVGKNVRLQSYYVPGTPIIGEITQIGLFFVKVHVQTEDAEWTNKRLILPNYLFITQVMEMEAFRSTDVTLSTVNPVFDSKSFGMDFETFMTTVRSHLDKNLVLMTAETAGDFVSYIGYKYKIKCHYAPDGRIVVSISFLSSHAYKNAEAESIIAYIENLRK